MLTSIKFRILYKRALSALAVLSSKIFSSRSVFKIPLLLLLLPIGLLFTFLSMLLLPCLLLVVAPFYVIRYLFWRLSAQGRIYHIQHNYRQRERKVIIRQQRKRFKLSRRSDIHDMQNLVKLSKIEISKRKQYVDHIIFYETKRRLNRCAEEMNFDDALHIYSTIVDTELDLLNETLNQLFN